MTITLSKLDDWLCDNILKIFVCIIIIAIPIIVYLAYEEQVAWQKFSAANHCKVVKSWTEETLVPEQTSFDGGKTYITTLRTQYYTRTQYQCDTGIVTR